LPAIAVTRGVVPHVVCSGVADQWVVAFTLATVAIPGLFGWIAAACILDTCTAAGVWVVVLDRIVAVRASRHAATLALCVVVDCNSF